MTEFVMVHSVQSAS